jgi:hypothetical protein
VASCRVIIPLEVAAHKWANSYPNITTLKKNNNSTFSDCLCRVALLARGLLPRFLPPQLSSSLWIENEWDYDKIGFANLFTHNFSKDDFGTGMRWKKNLVIKLELIEKLFIFHA